MITQLDGQQGRFFFPLLRPVEDPADDDEDHLKGYGSRIGERGHDSIIAPTAKRPGAGIRAAALYERDSLIPPKNSARVRAVIGLRETKPLPLWLG